MKDPIIRGPKIYFEDGRQYRVTAFGGLHYIRGNKDAHFSLTGEVDELDHWGRWPNYSGGCIHGELTKHWPDLAKLAALHLSDTKGVPMYAFENGWYWMAGALSDRGLNIEPQYHGASGGDKRTPYECLKVFEKHARISNEVACELELHLVDVANSISHYKRVYEGGAVQAVKTALASWTEAQKPRWAREAQEAIDEFGLVRYGDDMPGQTGPTY